MQVFWIFFYLCNEYGQKHRFQLIRQKTPHRHYVWNFEVKTLSPATRRRNSHTHDNGCRRA